MSIDGVSDEHCSNPETHSPHAWALGQCDGTEVRMPAGFGPGDDPLQPPRAVAGDELWGAPGLPRPWDPSSLTDAQLDELEDRLDRFAAHYNRTYATTDERLVLGCWRLHPAVWWELAALYAAWFDAYTSATASPREAASWHERLLPHFQQRLPGWFGTGTVGCTVSAHAEGWNPTAGKLASLAQVAEAHPGPAGEDRRALLGRHLSPHRD